MKGTKIFVGGIQGSGKTYMVANNLIPTFSKPIIYGVHPSDFAQCKGKIVIPNNYTTAELDRICAIVKQKAIEGECDAFIIDEADWFLPSSREALMQYTNLYDLIINHRHYKKGYPLIDDKSKTGLALIFVTRRPQSIPTEVIESCEYIITFAIGGENVYRKFRAIDRRFDELLPLLNKDKHNFIFMRIGEEPKIYDAVELRQVKGGDK